MKVVVGTLRHGCHREWEEGFLAYPTEGQNRVNDYRDKTAAPSPTYAKQYMHQSRHSTLPGSHAKPSLVVVQGASLPSGCCFAMDALDLHHSKIHDLHDTALTTDTSSARSSVTIHSMVVWP